MNETEKEVCLITVSCLCSLDHKLTLDRQSFEDRKH